MDKVPFREYADETRRLYYSLRHDKERREVLMARATRVNAPLDGDKVQTSPSDQMTEIMALLSDLDAIIEWEQYELEVRQNATMDIINKVDDLTRYEKEVLVMRAVNCWTWDMIAEYMYWSTRQLQRWFDSGAEKVVALCRTLSHSVVPFL